MPQAERVADLVHHDMLDRLTDELLGQLVLGLGLLFRGSFSFVLLSLALSLCLSVVAGGVVGAVQPCGLGLGQGDHGQSEVVLEAGLELAEAPTSAGQVLGELP